MQISSDAVDRYLDYCRRERRLSSHSVRAYRIDLTQFLSWLQRRGASIVGCAEVRDYLSYLNSRFAASTAKRKIASIRAFCARCSSELGVRTPFADIEIRLREPAILPRIIAPSDLSRLLDQAQEMAEGESAYRRFIEARDRAIVELLIATGIRVSELCRLDIPDIDLEQRQALITGKGARERIVQVECRETLSAIEGYLQARRCWMNSGRRSQANTHTANAVFLNRFGGRISEQSVRSAVKRRACRAGLTSCVTPHMFRHTFATILLEEDVNLRYIQGFLGHASIKTTERYTHVSRAKQREIMKKHNPREAFRLKR